jgi:hypothetical protein
MSLSDLIRLLMKECPQQPRGGECQSSEATESLTGGGGSWPPNGTIALAPSHGAQCQSQDQMRGARRGPETNRYYLRSLGSNPRKEPSDLFTCFPELATDVALPLQVCDTSVLFHRCWGFDRQIIRPLHVANLQILGGLNFSNSCFFSHGSLPHYKGVQDQEDILHHFYNMEMQNPEIARHLHTFLCYRIVLSLTISLP